MTKKKLVTQEKLNIKLLTKNCTYCDKMLSNQIKLLPHLLRVILLQLGRLKLSKANRLLMGLHLKSDLFQTIDKNPSHQRKNPGPFLSKTALDIND